MARRVDHERQHHLRPASLLPADVEDLPPAAGQAVVAVGVAAGVLAWLVAPAFGLSGWLLRVPLLRGIVVGVGGYLIGLRPRHFPVVKTARERAFCGVRP